MKKGSSFRSLTEKEIELCNVVLKRINTQGVAAISLAKTLKNSTIAIVIDKDKKFTTCLFKPTSSEIFLGISKRATYTHNNFDAYNENVGNSISLSRAIKNWYNKDSGFTI